MQLACPTCKRPTEDARDAEFPFCSERCRLLDLGAWASEKYRIAAPAFDESELDEETPVQLPPETADRE